MPQTKQLLVATNNPDKLREIRQILADTGWKALSLGDFPAYPEPPENEETLVGNALEKAREGFNRTGQITLADDTGLEVDALGGEPGVKSARYAGEDVTYADNVNLLLRNIDSIPEEKRTAKFRTVMALISEGVELTWEGIAEGIILDEARGDNGFGYDPIFWSPELEMTFAEANAEDKNRVSHRGRALSELPTILKELADD